MKKSANSLVRETRELLDEVLGEATVTLGSDTYFVPDYVVRDMFKSDKEWAKQAMEKVKQRRPSDVTTKYEPRVKAAVLPSGSKLANSFTGMNAEVQRDFAVIYYENKDVIDSFINSEKRTVFPGSGQSGIWSDSDLPTDVIKKVYQLETKGRTEVVGKGEALCLLHWSDGVPATGGDTSTATIDLRFGNLGASVKAVPNVEKSFTFKVNGTLNSFKKMAQDSLKASNAGAAVVKFSGLWSTSMSVSQIFEITKEQKATRDEFRALVDSINKAVREMEGSGAAGEYVYLVVSPTGWKSIPKKDEGFTFGGTTEGKVTVNYNMSSKLREAAELDTQQRFDAFIASNTASEGRPVANAESKAFEKYKELSNLPSLSGPEDAKSGTIKDIRKKIKDTLSAINNYKNELNDASTRGLTLRQNRQLALDAMQRGNCAVLSSLKDAEETLSKIPKIPKNVDDIKVMIAKYNGHMNQIFGTEVGSPLFPSPSRLSDEPDGQETFVTLLGPPSRTVSEGRRTINNQYSSRRHEMKKSTRNFDHSSGDWERLSESRGRKPRRSEASVGGVPGPAVPLGRGPTGRPSGGTPRSVLSRNARNQARYFGGGEEVDQTKLFAETRMLLEAVLGVNILSPAPVVLAAGSPGRAGRMTDYQLMEVYFSRRRGLLTESHNRRAQLITEEVGIGFNFIGKALGKGADLLSALGTAAVEAAKEVAQQYGDDVKAVVNGVKFVIGKMGDVLTYILTKIPGGEIVLEFVRDYASKMNEMIKSTADYMKGKLEEWMNSFKDWFLKYFSETLFDKNPDLVAAVEEKLGIDDGVKSEAKEEMKAEGMRTVRDFNRVMEERDAVRKGKGRIQSEAISKDVKKKALTGGGSATGAAVSGAKLAMETAKFMGVLAGGGSVNPIDLARSYAAEAVKRLVSVVIEVCSASKQLYNRCIAPLWPKFDIFKSGRGLMAAAFMGIATAGNASLETMTKYLSSLMLGWRNRDKDNVAPTGLNLERGAGSQTAAAKMFMAEKGKLLLELIVGILSGSNAEVLFRAFALGDVTRMVDAGKRIMGLILNTIRFYMKKNARQVVQDAAGGDVADEVEDGVAAALEDAFDKSLALAGVST